MIRPSGTDGSISARSDPGSRTILCPFRMWPFNAALSDIVCACDRQWKSLWPRTQKRDIVESCFSLFPLSPVEIIWMLLWLWKRLCPMICFVDRELFWVCAQQKLKMSPICQWYSPIVWHSDRLQWSVTILSSVDWKSIDTMLLAGESAVTTAIPPSTCHFRGTCAPKGIVRTVTFQWQVVRKILWGVFYNLKGIWSEVMLSVMNVVFCVKQRGDMTDVFSSPPPKVPLPPTTAADELAFVVCLV